MLILIPVSYAILWCIKKSKRIRSSTFDLLKERYYSQQIRKELEEKKESIINPKSDDASETNENFQKVIEDAIEEVSEEDSSPESPVVASEGSHEKESTKVKNEILEEEIPEIADSTSPSPILEPQPLDPKTQKLLERISVEANFLKNEGKFEDYEKKIIEGLALDPTNLELTKMLTDLYFTL